MSIATLTAAWSGLGATAVQAPDTTAAPVAASGAAPAPTRPHEHHHRHQDEGGEHAGQHDGQAYTALRIQVEQTFSALTGAGAANTANAPKTDGDSDEDGGGFAATLKARFSVTEGGMSASLSIRMGSEGQGAIGDLAAQMQGFVQTLYAALHTLLGGHAPNPNATLGTPVNTGAAAALTGSTDAPAAPATTGTASPTAAAAASPTPADASPPAAADAGAATATPAALTPTTSTSASASGSLSIKLRLTYSSFGSQLGPLTQQLAQPGAAQAAPGMADLLGELSTQFAQMLSASPAGSGSGLSLTDFLNALAKSFSPGTTAQAPANDASGAPVAAITDASSPAATTTPADTTAAGNPPLAAYGQVLSFSASVRSQWQLAA